MRQIPAHNSYAKAAPSIEKSYADRFVDGVETASKIYGAAQTAYGIARGVSSVAVRLAPLFGVL